MSPGAQNMKTGPDALGTVENESGSVKNENGTQRPRYHQKRVLARKIRKRDPPPRYRRKRKNETRRPWLLSKTSSGAQNMKIGPDALGTDENEFRSAKHEDGTRRPRYRRKLVWEHKT
jgi:hypothetical protein